MSNVTPSNFGTPGAPVEQLPVINPGDATSRASVANRNASSVLGAQTRIVNNENNTRAVRFTASGSWTVPQGATLLEITCQAGGGSGGGGGAAALTGGVSNQAGGSGGSAGGFVRAVAVAPPQGTVLIATVGTGGAGGAGGAASTGTTGNPGTIGGSGGISAVLQAGTPLVRSVIGQFGWNSAANSAALNVAGAPGGGPGGAGAVASTNNLAGQLGYGAPGGMMVLVNGANGTAGGGGGGTATATNGGGAGNARVDLVTSPLNAPAPGAAPTSTGLPGTTATIPGCGGGGGGGGAPGGAGGNGGAGAPGYVVIRVIG